MEHSTRITWLVIFASILLVLVRGAVNLPNQFCEPRPTLVAMGHPDYKYFPYFVTLHRCGGSCGTINPSQKGCVALTYTELQISSISFKLRQAKLITGKNHTSCGCKCIKKKSDCNLNYQRWDGASCECKCLFNNSIPPTPCPAGFRWNSNACQCECTKVPPICSVNKNWSNVDCKCVDVGPKTRRLRKRIPRQSEKKGVSSTLLVVFIVVEFAVLYIVFDAILYHRQAGIFYRIQLKLRKQGSTFDTLNRDEIYREMKSGDPIVTTVTITGKETAI